MKNPFQNADSRRTALVAMAAAVAIPSALAILLVAPRWKHLHNFLRQNGRLDAATAAARSVGPRQTVEEQLRAEAAQQERSLAEWDKLFQRVQSLQKGSSLADLLSSTQEGRIDFKVALFDARARLGRMAQDKKLTLPPDLGVPETIAADEDTEKRLWQLVSTVMLLEQCITVGIPAIERVEPLSPRTVALTHGDYTKLLFYPVRITMTCTYPQWRAFLDAARGSGTFFTLDAVRLERAAGPAALALRVEAVCSAVVFKKENKAEAPSAGTTNGMAVVMLGSPGN